MNKKIIVFFVCAIPILIISILNVFNWISYKYNIDMNPIGISNVEWVLFWGAYLGGVCTLIAVYYTITQNQKTFIYQYKMQAITKEKEIISQVLISLRILPIFNVLNIATNSALDDKQVGSILKYTADTQDNLDAGMVKLSFETSIYHDLCKICKHENECECELINIIKDFVESYNKLFYSIYNLLGDINDFFISERKYSIYKNIDIGEDNDVNRKSFDDIINTYRKINNNHNNHMTTLIKIGKTYIDFKEKELEKILVSKPLIKYEPDQSKISTIEKDTNKINLQEE